MIDAMDPSMQNRILRALDAATAKLEEAERAKSEPIAIIGMGCRFPGGADDPESFWKLLMDGRDAVGEYPAERWDIGRFYDPDPAAPGKTHVRRGGFLHNIEMFDAEFFGISPREALSLDPQQRLLLEVAWEALERAGQTRDKLSGSRAGVFIGISNNDYGRLVARGAGFGEIDSYFITGNTLNAAAGRISYVLGLHGPSLAVDTACSSSLVAIHLACQGLRSRECDSALAGGVNLILSPEGTIALSKARVLSTDGRCRTFDSSAGGMGRGEGCGMIVLKRLSDARRDGDRILAVIRGSAVNQDGPSSALTVPHGPAQEKLMRDALANARLEPCDIDYVEAHGTGTALGDPIEMRALGSVYGQGRAEERPLFVGAVKANIAHGESSAGIAGIIKTVMALANGAIPAQIHLNNPSPHIDWDQLPIKVPTTVTAWPDLPPGRGARRAAVSGFGFSGTNAHVILEEAPVSAVSADTEVSGPFAHTGSQHQHHLLILSAANERALGEQARRFAEFLAVRPETLLADVCNTAALERSPMAHRLSITAGNRDDMRELLLSASRGEGGDEPRIRRGRIGAGAKPKAAFLFSGQGSQYPGMGRELYESEPVFRETIDRCAEISRGMDQTPQLLELIGATEGGGVGATDRPDVTPQCEGKSVPATGSVEQARLVSADHAIHQTANAQPALYALSCALADLWRSWGILPSAVIGHSVGEYAAAYAAGVFSLEDGLRLITARGRLMQALPMNGAMTAIWASETDVRAVLELHPDRVSIAAVNGPSNVVISGERSTVQTITDEFIVRGVTCKPLMVSHAFHSQLMTPMLDEFRAVAERAVFHAPKIVFISNVTGDVAREEIASSEYWVRHVMAPVRFRDGAETLKKRGCGIFLEAGPHPTLLGMARLSITAPDAIWAPSLRRGSGGREQILHALGSMFVAGAPVDWRTFYRDQPLGRAELPTYPFQRERFWIDPMFENDNDPPVHTGVSLIHEVVWREAEERTEATSQESHARMSGARILIAFDGDNAMSLSRSIQACGGCAAVWKAEGRCTRATQLCTGVLREILDDASSKTEKVWIVTRRGQATSPREAIDPDVATLWGLGNVIALERPDIWGGMIDLDGTPGDPAEEARRILDEATRGEVTRDLSTRDENARADGETRIAFRGVRRLVQRMIISAPRTSRGCVIRPDATYLITGGLSGLGLRTASWLVDRGARYLVLCARRTTDQDARAIIDAMEAQGVRVNVQRADVSRADDIRTLLDAANTMPALRGVIHAAGITDDGMVEQMTSEKFERVMAAKIRGAHHLHEATKKLPLDFFVLYSSLSSVVGSPGQANYAAANAGLDALAHHRRSLGLSAISINWGPWSEIGMAARLGEPNRSRLAENGIGTMTPRAALDAMERILGGALTQVIVADLDMEKLPGSSIFRELRSSTRIGVSLISRHAMQKQQENQRDERSVHIESGRTDSGDDFLEGWSTSSPSDRAAQTIMYATKIVGAVLRARTAPEPDRPLNELGVDSMMATELKNRLKKELKIELPLARFIDGTSVKGLAELIDEALTRKYCEREVSDGTRPAAAGHATTTQACDIRPSATMSEIDSSSRNENPVLSFAQQRMWVLDRLEGPNPSYIIPVCVRLEGELDSRSLDNSLLEIIRRHEPLRSRFVERDGEAHIILDDSLLFSLEMVDLENRADVEAEAGRIIRETTTAAFDLARGPLLRARLLRISSRNHIFVMALHHIIADAWSMGVMLRELAVLYEARSADRSNARSMIECGKIMALPVLENTYSEFARRQRRELSGILYENLAAYWKKSLDGAPELLELPTDRPRPASQSYRGATEWFRIDADLAARVKSLGQSTGATPFMTLLAAVEVLLHRFSRQETIVVGSPIANRNRSEIENLIGFFVNTLVLRADFGDDPTFLEHLGRVRANSLGAYDHQDMPFEKLVAEMSPRRNLSHSPLFQVMFALQNAPMDLSMGGIAMTPIKRSGSAAKYDLYISMEEDADGLLVEWEYATDLFDAGTMKNMFDCLVTLLRSIVANPSERIGCLVILSEDERSRILSSFNQTNVDYPRDRTIVDLLEDAVRAHSGKTAVICGETENTYDELNRSANRVAHHLLARDVGVESMVGLSVRRSIDMMVGILGILKAGAVYVPIDPSYPRERIEFMMKDAGMPVVLTHSGLIEESEGRIIIRMDEDRTSIMSESDEDPHVLIRPDNPAYVIYTSGSTGQPKGILIEHRNTVALLDWAMSVFSPEELRYSLASTSLSFDISIFEIFLPLLTGGAVVIAENALELPDLPARDRITLINTVPSAMAELVRMGAVPRSVITVNLAGEPLKASLADRIYELGSVRNVYDLYGPAEDTTYSTYARRIPGGRATVGRAIHNSQAYILDRHLQPVPVGVPGEICLGGAGVARGYHDRPELTAERFIANPFIAEHTGSSRIYRTGDLGRWLPDGNIEFLGRIDNQVKIRGFRIELGEIENALLKHADVRACVVVARDMPAGDMIAMSGQVTVRLEHVEGQAMKNRQGNQRNERSCQNENFCSDGRKTLVAYVASPEAAHKESFTADLKSHLRLTLPEFMVPPVFVVLDALPMTPNGKIDRKALPDPNIAAAESTREFVAPSTTDEETLASIWSNVLGRQYVSVTDNFFEIGGDSIVGIRIISRAREAGLIITPRHIFRHQTIRELAAVADHAVEVTRAPRAIEGSMPLSPVQRWFFEIDSEHTGHFHQYVLLELAPHVRSDLLRRAIHAVAVHHDAFRLRFETSEGWRQEYCADEPACFFHEIAISANDAGIITEHARRVIDEIAGGSGNSGVLSPGGQPLRGKPLLHAFYFSAPDMPARFLIAAHHLVIDGVSWRILLEDLVSAYRNLDAGGEPSLSGNTESYGAWVRQLAHVAQSSGIQDTAIRWLETSSRKVHPLPRDHAVDDRFGVYGDAREIIDDLDSIETRDLMERAVSAYNTRPQELLLAALHSALADWTEESVIAVDLEGHGREAVGDLPDITRTIGWFTSFFPVVFDERPKDVAASIIMAKERLRSLPHRGASFGWLRALHPDPKTRAKLAALSSPEISFNYHGNLDHILPASSGFRFDATTAGLSASPDRKRSHLIEVGASITGEKLHVSWVYSERHHRRVTLERLASSFLHHLRRIIAHCAATDSGSYSLSDFPEVTLAPSDIDRINAIDSMRRNIETILPLAPAQEGILFHTLMAAEPDMYLTQLSFRVGDPFDAVAFRRAWETVTARHQALRTCFMRTVADSAVRVVLREVELPWNEIEHSSSTVDELMAADRRKSFDLGVAPAMRLTLATCCSAAGRESACREGERVFIWSSHHIILDGWSLAILMREVFSVYESFARGDRPILPPVVASQSVGSDIVDPVSAEQYWRSELKGFDEPVSLLFLEDRKSGSGVAEIRVTLPEDLTRLLREYSRKSHLTMNTLFQGVWAYLLSRCADRDDVVIGGAVSVRRRDLPGMETTAGLFINTIPIRVRVPDDERIVAWLESLQSAQAQRDDFASTPLADIQTWSATPRGTPLFESLFVWENYPIDESLRNNSGTLRISDVKVYERTNYPLTVIVTPGDAIDVKMLFDAGRFDGDAIRATLHRYESLLRSLVELSYDSPVSALVLRDSEEASCKLRVANATERPYPLQLSLMDHFEAQVARTPDSVAVIFDDSAIRSAFGGNGGTSAALTYGELDMRANQLAHRLIELGARPNDFIGVCMERSLEMIVALYGVLKAGCAYVPIDPGYPAARLEFMVEDSDVPILLARESDQYQISKIKYQISKIVHLDASWSQIAAFPSHAPRRDITSDDPAYMIYTSGSTGRPKGAINTHRGICNRLLWMQEAFGLKDDDAIMQKTPISFDVSVWELFWPLMTGARLVIAKPEGHKDPSYLAELARRERITTIHFVPPMLDLFLEEERARRITSLRRVICSGEALSYETQERFFDRMGACAADTCGADACAADARVVGPQAADTRVVVSDSDAARVVDVSVAAVELHNLYGPTEAGVDVTWHVCRRGEPVTIGRPIANTSIHILDRRGRAQPALAPGELHIGGVQLARGYHNRPELTREKFTVGKRSAGGIEERLYRTGDLARFLPSGEIEFLGRIDQQVKIRGFRIELGEIEAAMRRAPGVVDTVVVARNDELAGYFTCAAGSRIDSTALRATLAGTLPEYMIPSHFIPLDAIPLTSNGKIDRRALSVTPPDRADRDLAQVFVAQGYAAQGHVAQGSAVQGPAAQVPVAARALLETEGVIAGIWREVLRVERVGHEENFFDLGGHSLKMMRIHGRLREIFGESLTMVELFQYPTVRALARHLSSADSIPASVASPSIQIANTEIAVIGMACRFPGARNVDEFWRNLRDGVESIRFFTDEELLAAGVDPSLLKNPHYVKAGAIIGNPDASDAPDAPDEFDADFFEISPKEAEILDPQQRFFLECAWEAIESAGYDPRGAAVPVGVFAGAGMNTYVIHNLATRADVVAEAGAFQLLIANDKDYLPTRVSYKLNLKGPSVNVQTACSTSLVAISMACESLLRGDCKMALAGGVSLRWPRINGYLYQEGMIFSPDGHCRAFDAKAGGMIAGSGAGAVLLKRLDDALRDGDTIHAVVKGFAMNNDGAAKVGYTAPSVDGQTAVIEEAIRRAGVEAETITSIEAHGTGTPLGDPIEIAALTKAFRSVSRKKHCAIGSVKTNVGHLDAAAGVAGFIKSVLSLEKKMIPPSLHFQTPNPLLDIDAGPFFINAELREWRTEKTPRRAGVSSFGIGGTNAHVILEEAPTSVEPVSSRPLQLWTLSAKSERALESATKNLAAHLREHPEIDAADAAFTLAAGRSSFHHRRIVVAASTEEAASLLETQSPDYGDSTLDRLAMCGQVTARPELVEGQARDERNLHNANYCAAALTGKVLEKPTRLVFLFSGQGSQYPDMARDLYETIPEFRAVMDQCSEIIREFTPDENFAPDDTIRVQPALFALEYSLARLWMGWGIRPDVMIGHSIGEYVAACLAGVFSLEDGLRLVCARGRLMQSLPRGSMIAIPLSEDHLRPLLTDDLAIAALNAPGLSVASGNSSSIDALEVELRRREIDATRLKASHAFHSRMMDPILEEFTLLVASVKRNPPTLEFVSNLTGAMITPEEATDPAYWANHIRGTVRFADGISTILAASDERIPLFLEVGPGRSLANSVMKFRHAGETPRTFTSTRHPNERTHDLPHLLGTLGSLWLAGRDYNAQAVHSASTRRRIPLPTYPFERKRYWIDPPETLGSKSAGAGGVHSATGRMTDTATEASDITDWFWLPSWERSLPPVNTISATASCAIFMDENGVGEALVRELISRGSSVTTIREGREFARIGENEFVLAMGSRDDYLTLVSILHESKILPDTIFHLGLFGNSPDELDLAGISRNQERGFYSLLFLAQALGEIDPAPKCRIVAVTDRLHRISDNDSIDPGKATILGTLRVIPQEYAHLTCMNIDFDHPPSSEAAMIPFARRVITEARDSSDEIVAWRGRDRWLRTFVPVRMAPEIASPRESSGDRSTSDAQQHDTSGCLVSMRNASRSDTSRHLSDGGVYLITGGTGGVGMEMAEFIATTVRSPKLILLSRNSSHARDRIDRLTSLGACIETIEVDVSDADRMKEVVQQVVTTHGSIDGIIHAAGIAGGGLIAAKTRDQVEEEFAAKIRGTLVLASTLEGIDGVRPRFIMLCSSTNALVGGVGQIAYSAANAFLDAFAEYLSSRDDGPRVLSINWDRWRGIGMARGVEELSRTLSGVELPGGMRGADAREAFSRILESGVSPRIAVSTRDINALVREKIVLAAGSPLDAKNSDGARHKRPNLSSAYVAPTTETEEAIAAAWQEALGMETVGIHDDFSRLGGDSLLAVRLTARLRQKLGVPIGVRTLYEEPTIARLARHVDKLGASREKTVISIPKVARGKPLPVSMAQQRLWFLHHLDNKGATYNIPKALRFRGHLDISALEASLAAIIRRHESLRTSYDTEKGEPVQIVHDDIDDRGRLQIDDVVSIDEARRVASDEARTPFDLRIAPLIRPRLLRLASDDHVLLLTMHHIVSDGRSIEVLNEELALLYAALTSKTPAVLPPLPFQYADYAVYQRSWLMSGVVNAQIDYWKRTLDGAPPLLELPTDRPRPPMQTFQGAMEYFTIPEELTERLRVLSRDSGASLFMTFISAFAILMSRYSGQEEILIGAPVENRPFPDTERLIGVFINTLVIRADLSGDPGFRDFLMRMRGVALDAYANQDVPFEKIVEAVNPARNLSASPIFQAAISWLDGEKGMPSLSGLEVTPFAFDFVSVKFDLNLEVYETKSELGVAWFYNTALFDASTMRKMIGHFQNLLRGIPIDVSTRLSALPLLNHGETRRLVTEWNNTAVDYPRDRTVLELFEEQASVTPDAIAIEESGENGSSSTYKELNERANSLAVRLMELEIGPEKIVGIRMEHSIETLVAILGTWKAGGAYLPLDPRTPAARTKFMLEDSGAEVLLTQSFLGESPSNPALRIIELDRDVPGKAAPGKPVPVPSDQSAASALSGRSGEPSADSLHTAGSCAPIPREAGPSNAAYIIYTSGSTGMPKGVVIEHRGLTNYICWARKVYLGGETLDFPLFTSLSFDLTVTSLFVPIVSGGRIVAYRDDPESHVPSVFRVFQEKRVDIVKLTPAHLSMIKDVNHSGARVRKMILGGEDLKTELCRRITDSFEGRVELFNEYGPTETVVGCMIHKYDSTKDTGLSVPIGVPADNARIYLMDRRGAIVPTGAVGEMYISGDGVGRKYWNRPELTEERFLPDPHVQGSRMYRTGDLARWRSDGVMEYLGRADHQVKIRGHRIELDEIAASLARHGGVKDCVAHVIARGEVASVKEIEIFCSRCGLPSNYPGTVFDSEGVCNMCRSYEENREKVKGYFHTMDDLRALFQTASRPEVEGVSTDYDCIALFSGGKDSAYMLGRLVDIGLKVLAYTLDPGFLSDQAKENIRRVTEALGVDHIFGATKHMNAIFVESLNRHANVCNGCFKTLYTLSLNLAREKHIPFIVTGLSRGQFFETRLSMFYNMPRFDVAGIDRATTEQRKIYHRLDDVIARTLPVDIFKDESLFEKIQIVDFYRYCDVNLDDLYAYLDRRMPWVRPSDTGRSTNCLINDLGIYIHKKNRRYHNYALPYSWDVRMGHKKREAALEELHDNLDIDAIHRMMRQIGYEEKTGLARDQEQSLVAYYVSEVDLAPDELRAYLATQLPEAMIPTWFVKLDALPLTANGKIDRKALPMPQEPGTLSESYVAPRTPLEQQIAAIWSQVLGLDRIGVHDNFFTLGGHSLMATRIVARICEDMSLDLPLGILFDKPTIADLALAAAASAEFNSEDSVLAGILAEVENLTEEEAVAMSRT